MKPRAAKPKDDRTKLLAKIHVAKKQLGLDDDTYRDLLERVTGKRSAGELEERELLAVLNAFREAGWKGATAPRSGKPHVRKVWAIWQSMRDAGIVTADDSRAALRAFVLRLTGVADPEWLTADQATKVTESLKQWKKRVERSEASS